MSSNNITRQYGWYLFLLGLFSATQVRLLGSIGISEIVICLVAPFVFITDYHQLKWDGFLKITWLSILVMAGCVIACITNGTPFTAAMRGFATTYVMFSSIVVGHRLIRRCPMGIKWFYFGVAISVVINIFVFQTATELVIYGGGETGIDAAEGIMRSPIFWISRIQEWLFLPIRGWYLQTPMFYSVLAPLGFAIFAIFTSISGRSAAATTLMMAFFALLGGRKVMHLKILSKNSLVILIMSVLVMMGISSIYKRAATSGILGESAYLKYEGQMKGRDSSSILTLLMAGRSEFFVGAYACLQKPFIGYGPWAVDREGFYEHFVTQYGDAEDIAAFEKNRKWQERVGYRRIGFIPAHSHVISFWLWFGIFGLLFWLYVLFQYMRYFKKDLATVPQWFGPLGIFAAPFLWNFFFSPLGARVPTGIFIVLIMMTRAVRWGRFILPPEMVYEVERRTARE